MSDPYYLEPVHPVQQAALKRMTHGEKLDLIMDLWWMGRAQIAAGVKMRHPEWSDDEVEAGVKRKLAYGEE